MKERERGERESARAKESEREIMFDNPVCVTSPPPAAPGFFVSIVSGPLGEKVWGWGG